MIIIDNSSSFISKIEEDKLSLRKQNISKYLTAKRRKQLITSTNRLYFIDINTLDIDNELKEKQLTNIKDIQDIVLQNISSPNINNIKYALYIYKKAFNSINNLYNNNIISSLLDCLDKHIKDFVICVRIFIYKSLYNRMKYFLF